MFCEIDPETLNIDITDALTRISPRTTAIMPAHSCGNVCKLDALGDIASSHGLRVVEDAAHAFGARLRGVILRIAPNPGSIECLILKSYRLLGDRSLLDNLSRLRTRLCDLDLFKVSVFSIEALAFELHSSKTRDEYHPLPLLQERSCWLTSGTRGVSCEKLLASP